MCQFSQLVFSSLHRLKDEVSHSPQCPRPDSTFHVLSVLWNEPTTIYRGPTPSHKIIHLIKEGDHYDGCNSFKGFLNRSYFCDDCDQGYDYDIFKQHPCVGKQCPSCKRKDCNDFLAAKQAMGPGNFPKPQEPCGICLRNFHGTNCYNYHLQRRM